MVRKRGGKSSTKTKMKRGFGVDLCYCAALNYFVIDLLEVLNESILQEWVRISVVQVLVITLNQFLYLSTPFEERSCISLHAFFVVHTYTCLDVLVLQFNETFGKCLSLRFTF